LNDINYEQLAEEFLEERGFDLEKIYIEKTPVSEMICFIDENGREFDLPISDEKLLAAVIGHLMAKGVRVKDLR